MTSILAEYCTSGAPLAFILAGIVPAIVGMAVWSALLTGHEPRDGWTSGPLAPFKDLYRAFFTPRADWTKQPAFAGMYWGATTLMLLAIGLACFVVAGLLLAACVWLYVSPWVLLIPGAPLVLAVVLSLGNLEVRTKSLEDTVRHAGRSA